MIITNIIHILQLLVAVLLIAAILLQVRTQDLGGVFGAGASVFRARRGFEKTLFQATIGLSVIFVVLAMASSRFTG